MSMPGFVFHFRCESCGACSQDYPAYVFPDIFRPTLFLPAWSPLHECWGTVSLDLKPEQRRTLESDRSALQSFAASVSPPQMTIGVPRLSLRSNEDPSVIVEPDPVCPHCGTKCQTNFGYPPRQPAPGPDRASLEEPCKVPLCRVELSVRATGICRELGFSTTGDLEANRSLWESHRLATPSVREEFQRLIERSRAPKQE